MAASDCYDQSPIDPQSRVIRLIKVIESPGAHQIECELQCFPLASCPKYTALSYSWGDSRANKTIAIGNKTLLILDNLWHFLKEVQRQGEKGFYWIDAICINQHDTRERNHQVGMMRDIYSSAASVCVWIGTGSEPIYMAIDRIRRIGRRSSHPTDRKRWTQAQGHAILDLFQETYWRRVWIVQEIMLARELVLWCGQEELEWTCLEGVVAYLTGLQNVGRLTHCPRGAAILASDAARIIDSKVHFRNLQFEDKSTALAYILDKYDDMESSEIRDRVFGFLGLIDYIAPKGADLAIVIDYSRPIVEVFEEVYKQLQRSSKISSLASALKMIDRLSSRLKIPPLDDTVQKVQTEARVKCDVGKGKAKQEQAQDALTGTTQSETPTVYQQTCQAQLSITTAPEYIGPPPKYSKKHEKPQRRQIEYLQGGDHSIPTSVDTSAELRHAILSRLNDVLTRVQEESLKSQAAEALSRGFDVGDLDNLEHEVLEQLTGRDMGRHRQRPDFESSPFNFKKTWLYSNSRVPSEQLPLKVYMPTWQILCRAAEAASRSSKVSDKTGSSDGTEEREFRFPIDLQSRMRDILVKTTALDDKSLIILTIRCIDWSLMDWAVNLQRDPEEPNGFLDDHENKCHAAFLSAAYVLVKPLAHELRRLLETDPARANCSIILTGHNAGGAVASLLYLHMLSTTCESQLSTLSRVFRRVHCVTFGAPPVALRPLEEPVDNRKSLFFAFANEGDPVVRAGKEYFSSLAHLLSTPPLTAPATTKPRNDTSRPKLQRNEIDESAPVAVWTRPETMLCNAGRLIVLRTHPRRIYRECEAVCISDGEMRDVIFGDPGMHDMALYKTRIDDLAIAAVTGRA